MKVASSPRSSSATVPASITGVSGAVGAGGSAGAGTTGAAATTGGLALCAEARNGLGRRVDRTRERHERVPEPAHHLVHPPEHRGDGRERRAQTAAEGCEERLDRLPIAHDEGGAGVDGDHRGPDPGPDEGEPEELERAERAGWVEARGARSRPQASRRRRARSIAMRPVYQSWAKKVAA